MWRLNIMGVCSGDLCWDIGRSFYASSALGVHLAGKPGTDREFDI